MRFSFIQEFSGVFYTPNIWGKGVATPGSRKRNRRLYAGHSGRDSLHYSADAFAL